MDILKPFKNPIILGLLSCVSTYIYLKWKNDEKYKKEPQLKKPVDLLIPSVIGFGVFLLISGYEQYNKCQIKQTPLPANILLSDANPFEHGSFHLVGPMARIPVPDVFLEGI
jgi:hypothetical protein